MVLELTEKVFYWLLCVLKYLKNYFLTWSGAQLLLVYLVLMFVVGKIFGNLIPWFSTDLLKDDIGRLYLSVVISQCMNRHQWKTTFILVVLFFYCIWFLKFYILISYSTLTFAVRLKEGWHRNTFTNIFHNNSYKNCTITIKGNIHSCISGFDWSLN